MKKILLLTVFWFFLSHCSHRDIFSEPVPEKKVKITAGERACLKRGMRWQWQGPTGCRVKDFLAYCQMANPPEGVEKVVSYLKNEVSRQDCQQAHAALQQTTSLYLGDFEIVDIYPLISYSQLKILILNNNKIKDLTPLQGMKNLQVLRLEGNGLKKLDPLASLDSLVVLRLDQNAIDDVTPLAKLRKLAQLNLSQNQIKDIGPLQGLSGLRKLGLAGNQLDNLGPLGRLSQLTHLDVKDNPIMKPGFERDAFNCPIGLGASEVLKALCRVNL